MRNVRTVLTGGVLLAVAMAPLALLPGGSAGAAPAPLVRVTPTRLDFGPVPVGTSSSQSVTVTNVGTQPWTVGMAGGAASGPYNASTDCGGKTLAAGASCSITYAFTPTSAGVATGQSQPQFNDIGTVTIDLTGTGIGPFVRVTPTRLDFGPVPVGTSSSQSVTVTNVGTQPWTVGMAGGAASGPYNASTDCGGKTLAAGASCSITYAFTPTSAGVATGQSQPQFNDIGSVTIDLTGTGIGPFVRVTPTRLDFGPVAVGTSSSQSVTVTNVGTQPWTVGMAGGAASGPYSASTDCGGKTLAAGASCTITYTFTPVSAGVATGQSQPQFNDIGSVTIDLTGTGSEPPLRVTPTRIDFGPVVLGNTTPPDFVTITNTGSIAYTGTIAAGDPSSANFHVGNSCTTAIQPGASCTVAYSYTASGLGAASATATINADGLAPITVDLSGTGVAPLLRVTPNHVTFLPTVVGQSSPPEVVTITNQDLYPFTGQYVVNPPSDPQFVMNDACTGSTLQPGGSCTITYSFQPTAVGQASASASIGIEGVGGFPITLDGQGVPQGFDLPVIVVQHPGIDFGSIVPGTTSDPQTVTILNEGPVPFAGPITGGGGSADGQFASSNTCVTPIAAFTSCTFTYTYTPGTTSPATFTTTIGLGAATVAVTMSGKPVGPRIRVSPTRLDFGVVPVGQTASQDVTITNVGPAPWAFSGGGGGFNVPGDFGGFQNCVNAILRLGESCAFTYQFTPTKGGRQSNSTFIGLDVGGFPIDVAGGGDPQIRLSPTRLDFGPVPVGQTVSQDVTITNVGSLPWTFSGGGGGFNVPGDFGGFQNCVNATLQPGQSCAFTYQFTPTSAGTKTNSTFIGLDVGGFPIDVTGTGIGPFVRLSPTRLDFGPVPVGQTVSQDVTITNVGTQPWTFSGGGGGFNVPGDFGGFQNCVNATLQPGQSCAFTYQFTPTSAGTKTNSTFIGLDVGGFPIDVTGTGIGPFVRLSPTRLDFGPVLIGHTASQEVTITNVGTQPWTFSGGGGGFNVPGDFGGFQNCVNATLQPGQSCAFTYQFTPTSAGLKTNSTMIGLDVGNFPIDVSGTGVNSSIAAVTFIMQGAINLSKSGPLLSGGIQLFGGRPQAPLAVSGHLVFSDVTLDLALLRIGGSYAGALSLLDDTTGRRTNALLTGGAVNVADHVLSLSANGLSAAGRFHLDFSAPLQS